ncbi:ribonuclease III domain-containing protein [Hygrophoropsis aurantiaca]|uniref:Ribonuclease III domain-containing protein n=1 Tax=Hygrophoropsis aurantiaca TaxID=72124 RepID=A0ACB8AHN3_9AGAM|nr:ribonuclease III domain-containing protein [Hygrophoropsis aurantiaca]
MGKGSKPSGIHAVLQNAIVTAINDPGYTFSLPRLADWDAVISCSSSERERLEFIGDSLMHMAVALYLYQIYPEATPGLLTILRSAVNTNATFTHLMVKVGAHQLTSPSETTKAAADSFEIIIAALYMEGGLSEVRSWVEEQFAPIVAAARRSYDQL